ncbi:MAG: hypothetical protein ACKO7W_06590 [Elainella sp.]
MLGTSLNQLNQFVKATFALNSEEIQQIVAPVDLPAVLLLVLLAGLSFAVGQIILGAADESSRRLRSRHRPHCPMTL